nr:hypothetical protein [Tanacetum cinerariifolium]
IASGPERQPYVTAGAQEVAKGAPDVNKGGQHGKAERRVRLHGMRFFQVYYMEGLQSITDNGSC